MEKEDEGGSKSEVNALESTLKKFGFSIDKTAPVGKRVDPILETVSGSPGVFHYIPTVSHESLVNELIESHSIKRDVCLIGERGSGKSVCITRFAELSGYKIEPIVMYKDMTARDLLQQRTTKSDGDTVWRNSPLVNAALEGKLALLDGLDAVHSSTLAVIFRYVRALGVKRVLNFIVKCVM